MSTASEIFLFEPGAILHLDEWRQLSPLRAVLWAFLLLLTWLLAQGIYRIWFHPLAAFPGPRLLAATYFPYCYTNYVKGTWLWRIIPLHRRYGPVVRVGPNHIAVDGSIGWPEVFGRRKNGKLEFDKVAGLTPGDRSGIIFANTEDHRRQRRQLNHAFSEAAITQQMQIVDRHMQRLMAHFDGFASRAETFNIIQWFNFLTFDVIGELAFSRSFGCLETSEYHPWNLSVMKSIRGLALRRFFQSYPWLGKIVQTLKLSSTLETMTRIRGRAKNLAAERMHEGQLSRDGREDFVSYMLRKPRDGDQGMTELEVCTVGPTLVTAGSETSASAMAAFFFYVAQHPRVYRNVVSEIRAAFSTEQEINLRKIASLEYTIAALEETMRVYPPAPEVPLRLSPGDFIDGKFVPAGTFVTVYTWATFRNPANFLEPDSFIPERWLPATHPLHEERFSGDNHAAFKPFSYGPRDCIGKSLAYAEIRTVIVRILYSFDVELQSGQDDWHMRQQAYTIWQKGPLLVKLVPRTVSS